MKVGAMLSGALLIGIASTAAAQEPSDSTRADQNHCQCVRPDVGPDWTGRLSDLWRLEDGLWSLKMQPRIRLRGLRGDRLRLGSALRRNGLRLDRLRSVPSVRFGPELRDRLRFRLRNLPGRYRTI